MVFGISGFFRWPNLRCLDGRREPYEHNQLMHARVGVETGIQNPVIDQPDITRGVDLNRGIAGQGIAAVPGLPPAYAPAPESSTIRI